MSFERPMIPVAVLVDAREVAGAEPAVLERRVVRVAPVALHDVEAAHADLRPRRRADLGTLLVHEPHLGSASRACRSTAELAHGVFGLSSTMAIGAGLGGAVDLADRHAALVKGADQRFPESPSSRQFSMLSDERSVSPSAGCAITACIVAGTSSDIVRPPPRHVREPQRRVEARVQRQRRAGEQRRQRLVVQAADVEHRQHGEHVVGWVRSCAWMEL